MLLSFVKPVVKDYLALDFTFVGFDYEDDRYSGKIPEPQIHLCSAADGGAINHCNSVGDEVLYLYIYSA